MGKEKDIGMRIHFSSENLSDRNSQNMREE
jgi:hypothetical protein